MNIDTSGWKKFGESSNAEFFEIEEQVLAVVPHEGSVDTAATAKESVLTQLAYLRSKNRRAAIVVFMDRVLDQDAGARAVYRDLPEPAHQACFALVGGTGFGRAVGSIFIGLHPPRVPTKLFSALEDALAWAHDVIRA